MADPVELSIWTITENPADFPGQFVARRFIIAKRAYAVTTDYHVADTLDAVRGMLPAHLVRLPRDPSDQALIVESWI